MAAGWFTHSYITNVGYLALIAITVNQLPDSFSCTLRGFKYVRVISATFHVIYHPTLFQSSTKSLLSPVAAVAAYFL